MTQLRFRQEKQSNKFRVTKVRHAELVSASMSHVKQNKSQAYISNVEPGKHSLSLIIALKFAK